MYRPSREAAFLRDLLADFKGVLVSDFYSGYDSLPCEQQKCIIHLIRDFNADLTSNPYDEEFKALAAEFGRLLRSIVDTIDKHGLTKRHLQQHKAGGLAVLPRSGGPRLPLRSGQGLPDEVRQDRGQAVHIPGSRRGPLEQQSRRARGQGVRLLPQALRRHDKRRGALGLPRYC